MNKPNSANNTTEPVHVLTQRTVRPGFEERFEVKLHDFIERSLHAEGQLGVYVIRPVLESGSHEYGILRRFSDTESRDRFYESPIFLEWAKSVASLTEGEPKRQELSGLETWFTLPGQRAIVPPPRWKMAIVTILGVYPASLLVPWLLTPVIGGLPQLLQALFIATGIVTLLTWVIMPALASVLSPWLKRS